VFSSTEMAESPNSPIPRTGSGQPPAIGHSSRKIDHSITHTKKECADELIDLTQSPPETISNVPLRLEASEVTAKACDQTNINRHDDDQVVFMKQKAHPLNQNVWPVQESPNKGKSFLTRWLWSSSYCIGAIKSSMTQFSLESSKFSALLSKETTLKTYTKPYRPELKRRFALQPETLNQQPQPPKPNAETGTTNLTTGKFIRLALIH
jgi:hypothetical protein